MAIFGLNGPGETNHNKSECQAGAQMDDTNAVTREWQCAVEASIGGAVVAENSNETENEVPAVSANTKPCRRARSELQRYTSQQNGKEGGGPTTAAGKAISSQNATTHGLLAKRLMQLNDENTNDFAHVLTRLRGIYNLLAYWNKLSWRG
jgi:hypothetical protein